MNAVIPRFAAILLVLAMACPALGAEPDKVSLSLVTKTFKVDYTVAQDGALLYQVSPLAGAAKFQAGGQVFPARIVNKVCHGPRSSGALSVSLPNGDSTLQLVYESQTQTQESPGISHAVIVVRDRLHPLRVELHARVYAEESIIEQWLVLKTTTTTKKKKKTTMGSKTSLGKK